MSREAFAEVWIALKLPADGGRSRPAQLNSGLYRPHLRIADGEYLVSSSSMGRRRWLQVNLPGQRSGSHTKGSTTLG